MVAAVCSFGTWEAVMNQEWKRPPAWFDTVADSRVWVIPKNDRNDPKQQHSYQSCDGVQKSSSWKTSGNGKLPEKKITVVPAYCRTQHKEEFSLCPFRLWMPSFPLWMAEILNQRWQEVVGGGGGDLLGCTSTSVTKNRRGAGGILWLRGVINQRSGPFHSTSLMRDLGLPGGSGRCAEPSGRSETWPGATEPLQITARRQERLQRRLSRGGIGFIPDWNLQRGDGRFMGFLLRWPSL